MELGLYVCYIRLYRGLYEGYPGLYEVYPAYL